MPEWVIVTHNDAGDPLVVTHWIFGVVVAPVAEAKLFPHAVAVFRSRWDAKRVVRRWNDWRRFRLIRRDKL